MPALGIYRVPIRVPSALYQKERSLWENLSLYKGTGRQFHFIVLVIPVHVGRSRRHKFCNLTKPATVIGLRHYLYTCLA